MADENKTPEKKYDKETKNLDVDVLIKRDGVVVNGTGDIIRGLDSVLGQGILGIMRLG